MVIAIRRSPKRGYLAMIIAVCEVRNGGAAVRPPETCVASVGRSALPSRPQWRGGRETTRTPQRRAAHPESPAGRNGGAAPEGDRNPPPGLRDVDLPLRTLIAIVLQQQADRAQLHQLGVTTPGREKAAVPSSPLPASPSHWPILSPDFSCARCVRGVGVGANRLPTWEISRLDSCVRP